MDDAKIRKLSFRLKARTIENLKTLIEMGLAKNMTDAVECAVEHWVTEEKIKAQKKENTLKQ